jgi:hypothetical protein
MPNSEHLDDFRKLNAKYPSTMLLDTVVELGDFNDLRIYHLRFDTS